MIDELVREGTPDAVEALQAEVDHYIARFVAERDVHDRRLVERTSAERS